MLEPIYCPCCGTKLQQKDVYFCDTCGTKLILHTRSNNEQYYQYAPKFKTEMRQTKQKNIDTSNNNGIVIVVVVIIILVMIAIIMLCISTIVTEMKYTMNNPVTINNHSVPTTISTPATPATRELTFTQPVYEEYTNDTPTLRNYNFSDDFMSYDAVGNERLRSCPGFSCEILMHGSLDARVTVRSCDGEWCSVSVIERSGYNYDTNEKYVIPESQQYSQEGYYHISLLPDEVVNHL